MGKNLDEFFDNALELEESSYDEPVYEEPAYEEPAYEEPAYGENYYDDAPARKAPVNNQSKSKKPRVRKAGEKEEKAFKRPAVFEEAEKEERPRQAGKKPAPKRGGGRSSKASHAAAAASAATVAANDFLANDNEFEEDLRPARHARPARRSASARPASARPTSARALKPIPPAPFYDDDPAPDYDDYDGFDEYAELDEFDGDFEEAIEEVPEVKEEPKRRPKRKSYDEELDEFEEDAEERPRKKPIRASKKKAEQIPGESSGEKIDQDDKKKRKNLILIIIIIIAAGVLIFSGIKLFQILGGYKKGSDTYKKIENIAKPSNVDPNTPEEEVPFSVDMQALIDVNPDAKGYIYGKGIFSYPIVQGGDNSYYLTHLFDGTENSCGCLFIDANLPEGMESRNCIVYGHNMNDGSMFAPLHQYGDESFYKDHKEFEIFTNDHHYIYKMLSCFVTPVDGIVYTRNFASDEDFVNFLYEVAGTCPYETEYPELNANSKVMTLSTCLGNDDDDHRFVVVLIRDHEVIDTPAVDTTAENNAAPEETQAPDVETEIPEEDL